MTIVPLKLYFNEKGRAKIEIALARGKKLHDKRETLKKRSWERERGRLMRQKGLNFHAPHRHADLSAPDPARHDRALRSAGAAAEHHSRSGRAHASIR